MAVATKPTMADAVRKIDAAMQLVELGNVEGFRYVSMETAEKKLKEALRIIRRIENGK
jgi:tRNA(Phe) wybutosine-synthesizing methylase Tyw3